MLNPRRFSASSAPVAELERRTQWRAVAILAFLGILVGLAVVAVIPMIWPPATLTGLPDDPDVSSAVRLVHDRLKFDATGLRFFSALLGDNSVGSPYDGSSQRLVGRAGAYLGRARARHPRDARIAACLASLDLLRGDVQRAVQRYRAVLDLGPSYGEGHLGLGVALALEAAGQTNPLVERALLLQAIGQFAAVGERDPVYEAALYNRAVLLVKVGRREEARRLARRYFARDPSSPWAGRLEWAVGMLGR